MFSFEIQGVVKLGGRWWNEGIVKIKWFLASVSVLFYLKLHVIMNFKSKDNKGGSFQKGIDVGGGQG